MGKMIEPRKVWEEYQKGVEYNTAVDLYETVRRNENELIRFGFIIGCVGAFKIIAEKSFGLADEFVGSYFFVSEGSWLNVVFLGRARFKFASYHIFISPRSCRFSLTVSTLVDAIASFVSERSFPMQFFTYTCVMSARQASRYSEVFSVL